ncbi:hypothetical protein CHARACLAT_015097 [Characodon lateralis]|uniref:Uncharacterized protein n=1 Tax=Characodon lateralis TaxID=208331 RepID=A0ABU7ETV2_9TELE|nr:hypothetical protein [Characodon lateralis]
MAIGEGRNIDRPTQLSLHHNGLIIIAAAQIMGTLSLGNTTGPGGPRDSSGHTGGTMSLGLGTPWAVLLVGAGRGVWPELSLGVSTESAAPATRSHIKRKTTSTSTSMRIY